MRGPIGFGHGMMGVFGAIVGFLGTVILIAIIVAVLFFLIRFLIVGTKAAQLYIDTNRVAPPAVAVVEPVETTAPAPASPSTPAPSASVNPPKPEPKPRTPKTPPSADS